MPEDKNNYRAPVNAIGSATNHGFTKLGDVTRNANTAREPAHAIGAPIGGLNGPQGKMAPAVGNAPAAAPAHPQAVLPIAPPPSRPATMDDLNGAVSRINEQMATLKELQGQSDGAGKTISYETPVVHATSTYKRGFPFGHDNPWGIVNMGQATVTIAAGEFEAGSGTVFATAQTTLTIGSDASYIGLEYDPNAGTLVLIGPTTSKPTAGDGKYRTWLYFFGFDGVNAIYKKHNLTGNWHAAIYAYEAS